VQSQRKSKTEDGKGVKTMAWHVDRQFWGTGELRNSQPLVGTSSRENGRLNASREEGPRRRTRQTKIGPGMRTEDNAIKAALSKKTLLNYLSGKEFMEG